MQLKIDDQIVTSQRALHAPADGDAGFCFSLCRPSCLKDVSSCRSCMLVPSFSSHELRSLSWQGEACDAARSCLTPGLPQRNSYAWGFEPEYDDDVGPMEGEAIDVSGC